MDEKQYMYLTVVTRDILVSKKEIINHFSLKLLHSGFFPTLKQAKKIAKTAVNKCNRECKESVDSGKNKFLSGTGELLFRRAESGDEYTKKMIENAYAEGATEKDFLDWWNLPFLQRGVIYSLEEALRITHYYSLKYAGLSDEEAAEIIRRLNPSFTYAGTQEMSSYMKTIDDCDLCHELRFRIDDFFHKCNREDIYRESQDFTSMNAYLKSKIISKEI